jgi:hypothetical protein
MTMQYSRNSYNPGNSSGDSGVTHMNTHQHLVNCTL